MSTVLLPDATLAEAREVTRRGAVKGTTCACCGQHVRIYRRPLNHVPAAAMIALYRTCCGSRDFAHIPTVMRERLPSLAGQGGYAVLGQHWSLIEEENIVREDGGRAGYWRLTDFGVGFVCGWAVVQKFARIYNGECLGHDGFNINIHDALGTRFDYRELLYG